MFCEIGNYEMSENFKIQMKKNYKISSSTGNSNTSPNDSFSQLSTTSTSSPPPLDSSISTYETPNEYKYTNWTSSSYELCTSPSKLQHMQYQLSNAPVTAHDYEYYTDMQTSSYYQMTSNIPTNEMYYSNNNNAQTLIPSQQQYIDYANQHMYVLDTSVGQNYSTYQSTESSYMDYNSGVNAVNMHSTSSSMSNDEGDDEDDDEDDGDDDDDYFFNYDMNNPSAYIQQKQNYYQQNNGKAITSKSSSYQQNSTQSKRKRKRILNKIQRQEATMREKRRMLKLNKAFEDLRKVLPISEFAKNKLSRAETLKSAIEYIDKMTEMLLNF